MNTWGLVSARQEMRGRLAGLTAVNYDSAKTKVTRNIRFSQNKWHVLEANRI